jgi:hypothetical protein
MERLTMTRFTQLELAALHSIFSETPEVALDLERQLSAATVTKRENSGAGFFTTINVAEHAPRVRSQRVLGYETPAHVAGMEYGLGFLLSMKEGALGLLEGYALAGSTSSLDLTNLRFQIFRVAENETVPASPLRPA